MRCEMGKVKVVMNKPVYLGQAIIDFSKIIMYEFHYDYRVPKYGKKLDLCYMDTDSLIYNIETRISIRILRMTFQLDSTPLDIYQTDLYQLD